MRWDYEQLLWHFAAFGILNCLESFENTSQPSLNFSLSTWQKGLNCDIRKLFWEFANSSSASGTDTEFSSRYGIHFDCNFWWFHNRLHSSFSLSKLQCFSRKTASHHDKKTHPAQLTVDNSYGNSISKAPLSSIFWFHRSAVIFPLGAFCSGMSWKRALHYDQLQSLSMSNPIESNLIAKKLLA